MGVLRFILALSVIVAHTSTIFNSHFVGGIIAVKAFYIISGFYMSLVLNEKYIGVNNKYSLFIVNRFLRLFPVYWFVLLLTIIFSFFIFLVKPTDTDNIIFIYKNYIQNNSISLYSIFYLITVNLIIIGQDLVLFLGLNSDGGLFFTSNFQETSPHLYTFLAVPQAWTISLELMFYLIAPFLVRRKLILIVPLIMLSFLFRLYLYKSGLKNDPWNYRFFPLELGFFLLGNVAYRIYARLKTIIKVNDVVYYVMVTIIVFVTLFYEKISLGDFVKSTLYYCMIFCFIPLLILSPKKRKLEAYIGELSYLLYISHLFILIVIKKLSIPYYGQLGLVTFLLTVGFSIFCNEFIAQNVELLRQRRVARNITKSQSKFE